MSAKTGQFSPFGENTMTAYKALVASDVSVSAGTVQNAIDALREREIVWKESRGSYEIEDQAWRAWLHAKGLTEK